MVKVKKFIGWIVTLSVIIGMLPYNSVLGGNDAVSFVAEYDSINIDIFENGSIYITNLSNKENTYKLKYDKVDYIVYDGPTIYDIVGFYTDKDDSFIEKKGLVLENDIIISDWKPYSLRDTYPNIYSAVSHVKDNSNVCGYDLFFNLLYSISDTNGNSLDIDKTYGLTRGDANGTRLKEELNKFIFNSDTIRESSVRCAYVERVTLEHKNGKGSDTIVICDYIEDINSFVYYFVSVGYNVGGDNYRTLVFKSEDFIDLKDSSESLLDNKESVLTSFVSNIVKGYSEGENIEGSKLIQYEGDRLTEESKDRIEKLDKYIAFKPSSNVKEDMATDEILNNLVDANSVDFILGTPYSIEMSFEILDGITSFTNEERDGLPFILFDTLDKFEPTEGIYFRNNSTLYGEAEIEINTGASHMGDSVSDSISLREQGSAKYSVLAGIMQNILNDVLEMEEVDKASNVYEKIGNAFRNSEIPEENTISLFFALNKKVLNNCISKQEIDNFVTSSVSTEVPQDSYSLMIFILQKYFEYKSNINKSDIENMVYCGLKYKETKDSVYIVNLKTDHNIPEDATTSDNKNVIVKSIQDIYNDLNAYQRYTVSYNFNKKLEDLGATRYASVFDLGFLTYECVMNTDTVKYNLLTPLEYDSIKAEVDAFEDRNANRPQQVVAVLRNSGTIAKYIVAKGLLGSSSDKNSELYLSSDLLDLYLPVQWNYGKTDEHLFIQMPSKLGHLFSNKDKDILSSSSKGNPYYLLNQGSVSYGDYLQNLLYNVHYALQVCAFSEYGESMGYTYENLVEFFDKDNTDTMFEWLKATEGIDSYSANELTKKFNFQDDPDTITMLRAIIEFHDMCEFLGIEQGDWTVVADAYLKIYEDYKDFFVKLKEHGVLYEKSFIGTSTNAEPLGRFFSVSEQSVSDQWKRGFAVSSLFTPMETNLYNASSISYISDEDWISDFYYRYGFYRKALYITTDNAAVVKEFVSGEKSPTTVATLRDLINYDRDIILYVDDDFYNAKDINEVISSLDYTAIRGGESSSNKSTWFGDKMNLTADTILKTDSNNTYSTKLFERVTKFGQPVDSEDVYDMYLLSQEEIIGTEDVKSVLDDYEYSIRQPYGVVSAIYRSDQLFREYLEASSSDNAIFRSSKAIAYTSGTSYYNWLSLYNYYMLANLSEQMKSDVASTLDLDAPLFCDLFGNIVTESGLVIIPAACNATLCGTDWNPYSVGFSEYYNNGNRIPIDDLPDNVYSWLVGYNYARYMQGDSEMSQAVTEVTPAGGFFAVDTSGVLALRRTTLTSGNMSETISWESTNKNSDKVKTLFFNDTYYRKSSNIYGDKIVNLVTEVLRGAPIEYIDYVGEGIEGNTNISKLGIYSAYKLEEVVNALVSGTNGNSIGGNSVVTLPNLAFIEGVETFMLYFYKVLFAVTVIGFVVTLILDSFVNKIGLSSVASFIMTCLLCIMCFTVLPNVISWTYYGANKTLLSEEASDIMMLNYMKEFDGAEIGITSITTPETDTELLIKVGNVSVKWWKIVGKVLFDNTVKTMSELYEESLSDNVMAMQKDVMMKADGLYVDVQDIFNSTNLSYHANSGKLRNQVLYRNNEDEAEVDTIASYVLPYYVILDYLVENINEYNSVNNIQTYSWDVGSNGHILTYDIVGPYLTSSEFMEPGYDILGLNGILPVNREQLSLANAFSQVDRDRMKFSAWYPSNVPNDVIIEYLDYLTEYARNYVVSNADIIGKIPDEVFLKVMAFQLALEYNRKFNIGLAESVELLNIDTRDLMRFMVADDATVFKNYSYSFARFVYEETGGIGVLFAGVLTVILWITSFLKPMLMIVLIGLLIVNSIGRKLLFKKENRALFGYLIACGCLALSNYAYALMLKASMVVADLNFGSIAALCLAIIVQLIYVAILIGILMIEVKDWKNSGYEEFYFKGATLTNMISRLGTSLQSNIARRNNDSYRDSYKNNRSNQASSNSSRDTYDKDMIDVMLARDDERVENGNLSLD